METYDAEVVDVRETFCPGLGQQRCQLATVRLGAVGGRRPEAVEDVVERAREAVDRIIAREEAALGGEDRDRVADHLPHGVERLVDLGNEVAASGGPPTPEQQAQLDQLSRSLERHGKIDLVLLLLAVTAMATARYW